MSDSIYKIIPKNPYTKVSKDKLNAAKSFIESAITCDSVDLVITDNLEFIDCGSNLVNITCPKCGKEISFDWWNDAMDIACEDDFKKLDITLPCCGGASSLNDLRYDFKCGFACCSINVTNPEKLIDEDDSLTESVQKILDCEINWIIAHY